MRLVQTPNRLCRIDFVEKTLYTTYILDRNRSSNSELKTKSLKTKKTIFSVIETGSRHRLEESREMKKTNETIKSQRRNKAGFN